MVGEECLSSHPAFLQALSHPVLPPRLPPKALSDFKEAKDEGSLLHPTGQITQDIRCHLVVHRSKIKYVGFISGFFFPHQAALSVNMSTQMAPGSVYLPSDEHPVFLLTDTMYREEDHSKPPFGSILGCSCQGEKSKRL